MQNASPPSSLARATSPIMRLSPSERAAEDSARIKARIAKNFYVPGKLLQSHIAITC